MNHGKRTSKSARSLTAVASAVALALGTLSLAGCSDDEELPPVEEERPVTGEQTSPMQDATSDPGIDQTGTASGDGAAEPISGTEEPVEGDTDATLDQEPLPGAEQEPMADDQLDGQQPTMDEGENVDTPIDEGAPTDEEQQSGN